MRPNSGDASKENASIATHTAQRGSGPDDGETAVDSAVPGLKGDGQMNVVEMGPCAPASQPHHSLATQM